ncbi:30S ribosomal protein S2 [Candidatus Omnitrophota bacterium]
MPAELVKQLLEAGVHFGHKTSRWNPKMAKFIFGKRCGIYIIDLEKTAECLNKARDFLLELASRGQNVIFVGTKKQAQDIIKEESERCSMYYVNVRWLGGLLTNFSTIKRSIKRLKEIDKMREDGTFRMIAKKEIALLEKEAAKLRKNLSGIVHMENLPAALVIVDTNKESTALKEARRLKIPIVAITDTNSNPDIVDYPVPGNDDAIKSVRSIISLFADAVIEGRKRFLSYLASENVPKDLEKHPDNAPQAQEELVKAEVKEEIPQEQGEKKPSQ